ncbi:MAG: LuxR C-terminal-related transcriptional regulator [Byssovorax sp.]
MLSERIRPCQLIGRPARYEAELRLHRAGSIGFSVIRISPSVTVVSEQTDECYLFETALAGGFRARCHGPERAYADGAVHVVNPNAPLRIDPFSECTFLVIRMAKSTFAEHARVLTDAAGDACHLPELLPVALGEAASLWRYLRFLHAESMTQGSALHHGRASRSAEQMVSSLMLAVAEQGGTSGRPDRAGGSVAEDQVRRAEEYIEGHLDDDIGMVDIVGSAGVDGRALDAGFQRRRGVGPLAWLERRRDARTARELGADRSEGEAAGRGDRPLLTWREIEIARLVAAGLNNLEIAQGLVISRNTVKEALKRIFRKIGVDSRAEMVLRLSEARLL